MASHQPPKSLAEALIERLDALPTAEAFQAEGQEGSFTVPENQMRSYVQEIAFLIASHVDRIDNTIRSIEQRVSDLEARNSSTTDPDTH